MSRERASGEQQRNALKTAFKRVLALLGGVDAAAATTRVGRSNLSEYGVPQMADRHAPIDVVLDLEIIAGTPLVTEALAAAQGYVLLPVHIGTDDVAAVLAELATDAGKTMADAVQAIRDGMPPHERAVLVSDLTELHRVIARALGLLQPNSERPAPLHAVE